MPHISQKISKNIKRNIIINQTYEFVDENITHIISKYEHILNPKNNMITKKYLDTDPNNIQDAYAESFTTLLLLYMQINDII